MLYWHLSLESELWVSEPMIKHSQQPSGEELTGKGKKPYNDSVTEETSPHNRATWGTMLPWCCNSFTGPTGSADSEVRHHTNTATVLHQCRGSRSVGPGVDLWQSGWCSVTARFTVNSVQTPRCSAQAAQWHCGGRKQVEDNREGGWWIKKKKTAWVLHMKAIELLEARKQQGTN